MTSKIIIVTGASSSFGRLSANALAQSGYTVYAAMREVGGRNAKQADDVRAYARQQGVDLRVIELDVCAQDSVDAGCRAIVAEHGRIDVVVHGAGHMAFGPAEAFTPEQFAELYDVNLVSTQRVNRAVLPHMRSRGQGLLVWVSMQQRGRRRAALPLAAFRGEGGDGRLAVQYARELSRWGIETSIIVPGIFVRGRDHFSRLSREPADASPCCRIRGRPLCRHRQTDPGRGRQRSSPRMPTPVRWPAPSPAWWTRRSANGRSACTSTPARMAPPSRSR